MDEIILVDSNGKETGSGKKTDIHREGKLHRAFSIFVFNSRGEMLLHRRNSSKYHSGGLWTNACCSHPRKGERLEDAVHRRLREEMGFDTELKEIFSFTYKVKFDNGLFEHEYDHVFVGSFDGEPRPDPEEVEDFMWVSPDEVKRDIQKNPEKYTYWFREAIGRVMSHINKE